MTPQDIIEIRQATYKMCRFGLQTIVGTLLLSTAASAFLISQANAATLKQTVTINDDVVRLGDLFDNVDKPDIVLGAGPQPGQEMTLSAAALQNLASNNAVDWKATSIADKIVIHRDAHQVDEAAISDTLKAALVDKGVKGTFNLTLSGAHDGIVLPATEEATAVVKNLNYSPDRDVFTATIVSPSLEKPLKTLNVSGLINHTVSVPSVTATLRQGSIISASDIAWIDVPEHNLSKDVLLDADELIGKTPSRVLVSNRPIKAGEVANPQLVARGDDVTIVYLAGGMSLSAKGKSQQAGAQGDLIRVTNLSSSKSFSAQVTGDHTVTVQ